ncbi:hypothetical protein CASFOL_018602 [Castilleja foliolosa]|uniref:BHLH domain-containing protein n=1 Tax=Castilleja foliolosa TaxID=1961234 RepID=A0ABD3D8C0_9LAMI
MGHSHRSGSNPNYGPTINNVNLLQKSIKARKSIRNPLILKSTPKDKQTRSQGHKKFSLGSSGVHGRRRNSSRRTHGYPPPPPNQAPQSEITANRYVFAAATPYPPSQYPNPNAPPYYQYPGYYPPPPPAAMPMPLPNLGVPGNYSYARESGGFDNLSSKSKLPSSSSTTPLKIEEGEQLYGQPTDVEMEKLLEESVMCRTRAKRGCATHPRSIAERVRRTRISDRIRKLQDLVPNMDKWRNRMFSRIAVNTLFLLSDVNDMKNRLERDVLEFSNSRK